MNTHELRMVPIEKCRLLKRNPQHLTEKQMTSLMASIRRDGFVSPILLRPLADDFEIVSGNHRFLAAKELGAVEISAVIVRVLLLAQKRSSIPPWVSATEQPCMTSRVKQLNAGI